MPQTLELDYSPFEYQQALHSSSGRFKIIAGGRRVGKSKMALMELIKHCATVPKGVAWWVGMTISSARDVGWKEFKEIAHVLDPIIKNMNETRMEVTFKNGAFMAFKGADNEPALRGRGLTMLVIDEAAFISQDTWVKVLRPALSDRKGKALLISTPNGKNWFHDVYYRAANEHYKLWDAFHWPTMLNPLIDDAELVDAAQDMDEISFRQEYLAEFITAYGMVYAEFTQDNVLQTGLPSTHNFDIYLGMDFGFANPSAICFMAIDHDNGNVIMFDEISEARVPIDRLEWMIIEKLAKWGFANYDVKAIYADPAGNAGQLVSGISPVDWLRNSPMNWNVTTKGSEIMPGVSMVRSYILNARGQRRFFITNNCRVGLDSITGYTYSKQNTYTATIKEEPLKDGKFDHMCDAIRYFFVNHFDQSKYIADKPNFAKRDRDDKVLGAVFKRCGGCRGRFLSHTPKNQPPFKCRACLGEFND